MQLTQDAIAQALRLGEDSANEFKSLRGGLPHADDLAAAIVAFANSGGGRLWLGVENDGMVSGVGGREACDSLLRRLDDVCENNVAPPIVCGHHKAEYEGEVILLTEVPGFGSGRPYRTRRGVYYVRGAASRRIAPPDEVRRLVLSAMAAGQVPDEAPVAGTSLEDMDLPAFRAYYEAVYGDEAPNDSRELRRLLANLRILIGDQLSLMGVLCFASHPQRRLPWARITAARSSGTEIGGLELLDRKDFEGTLDRQIEAAEDFVQRHLAAPVTIRGFESETPQYPLPLEAVREAIRNAVAHRDYGLTAQINITLYGDRLEVVSPGRLLNAMSIEAMKLGTRLERNPLVVTVLAKRHLMTERGSGVPRMLRLMRQQGLPEPEFEERGPSLVVRLRMKTAQP